MIELNRDPRMERIFDDIIRIARLILVNAIQSFSPDEMIKMREGNKKLWNKFTYKLFANWKKAQREILTIQLLIWEINPNFQQDDPFLLYIYRVTQRLLDCIIWHHYGPDITDIKRLYEYEPKIQNLRHHNIDSHIEEMEKLNSSTRQFALLSDLTSGLRIGDLFLVNKEKQKSFIEVKEGSVNTEILEAKNSNNDERIQEIMSSKSKSKQLKRMERQEKRAHEALKMIRNEEGEEDRYKGQKVRTVINPRPFEDFSEELRSFLSDFNKSNDPIKSLEIESCLLIFAYKPIKPLKTTRDALIEKYEENSTIKGMTLNWNNTLTYSSVFRPIFMQPIDPDCIDSIVKGELIVDFYFSLEKFKEKFKSDEVKIFFNNGRLFRKAYDGLKKLQGPSVFYEKNQGTLFFNFTKIAPEANEIFSEGLFSRLISNLALPSYLLYLHEFMTQNMHYQSSAKNPQDSNNMYDYLSDNDDP